MEWYRWRPGAIPQLERLPMAVRGVAHAVLDFLWIHPEEGREWEAVIEDLMLDVDLSEIPQMGRLYPILVEYILSERENAEAFKESRREHAQKAARARWAMHEHARACTSNAHDARDAKEREKELPNEKPSKSPPTPPRGKPRPKPAAAPEPSLEEILGGKGSKNWERYWKLAQLWPSEKNPAPKRSARAFLKAMEQMQGKEPAVYWAAQAYREKHEDPTGRDDRTRFMKLFETWLAEEGWQAEREVMREAERAV